MEKLFEVEVLQGSKWTLVRRRVDDAGASHHQLLPALVATTLSVIYLLMSSAIRTTAQLYKHLLKECRSLPKEVQDYYMHYWRQQLNSHLDEQDPQRLKGIIEQAMKDMHWLKQKYSKADDE